ncbi:hypothetical protein D9M69_643870 [compost metagenome]
MVYATLVDLTEQFGSNAVLLVADRNEDGEIDAEVVASALTNASAEIDTYVGVKHRLPLPLVPQVLVLRCCEIALYRLSADAGSLTEEKRKRYDDAVAHLRRIASGDASLGLPTPPEESSGYAFFESQPKRFGDLL